MGDVLRAVAAQAPFRDHNIAILEQLHVDAGAALTIIAELAGRDARAVVEFPELEAGDGLARNPDAGSTKADRRRP